MAGVEKSGGKGFADAFEEAAGKLLDETAGQQAPGRPTIGHGEGLPPEQVDQVDAAFESVGAMTRPGPGVVDTPTKVDEGRGNQGDDVVDPAKPSQPPSDRIEGPDRPAEIEPTTVQFPDHEPAHQPEGSDDLGLPPSERPDLEHEDTGAVDSSGFGQLGEGDLMPAEVQEPGFPDAVGTEFDDPGFTLEPSSDFGAEDEVPADAIEGFDGAPVDEGF